MAYKKEYDKLIFKFNGGNGAVLCSNCFKIIFSGKEIPNEYWDAAISEKQQKKVGACFCSDKCKNEFYTKK